MAKHQSKQYRNINGDYFKCYTSDPAAFDEVKKLCRKGGLKFRVINSQLYTQVK